MLSKQREIKMKLKNGDEVEVGGQRYRVIDDELYELNKGFPPARTTIEIDENVPVRLDQNLIDFYLKKGYDVCPSCGRGKDEEGLTGCPKGCHNGTYCLAQSLKMDTIKREK